ncbi:hypothetical protein CAS74_004730 [Pichia kudriavzevii]|uniref:Protein TOXD n=1 Tax=Pichia kudriavzevii TaxID=4909 RepID=A0A099P213_PICKU|nr:uncharacterized protein C5L36_0B10350 [Pichia kudriavzevii]AWU75800.1 hypothetical protein C5L36_0B10350 [Pichia kudriavzevii]KGK38121.1 hypothetical protein JL09_g2728 [Pichia kudriavzevii]ONH77303.1 Protein TOXD [Pichia kudriavzevii]OUT20476.1 hypothetical protein CAS74_004730 [Pichia kudriavzevii]
MSLVTIRSVVYTGEASPLVKVVETTTELPTPGPGELLVKVQAAAFNPTDYKHFYAKWGSAGTTVGSDLAGTVVSVGSETSGFKEGDTVASFLHGGYDPLKNSGAFQDYVVVPAITTLNLPGLTQQTNVDNIDPSFNIDTFEKAASLPLGLYTVGMSLENNFGKPKKDSWILVWGGTTATGYLAIQIAKKIYGAKVITTANKAKYESYLKAVGADVVIDYHDDKVIDQLKAATADNIEYALDTVSNKDTFNKTYAALRPTGKSYIDNLLSLGEETLEGQTTKKDTEFSKTFVYLVTGESLDLNGFKLESSPEIVANHKNFHEKILKAVKDGEIKTMPIKIYPNGFNSADAALKELLDGVSFKKLVIRSIDN